VLLGDGGLDEVEMKGPVPGGERNLRPSVLYSPRGRSAGLEPQAFPEPSTSASSGVL
jgi:hypothetical protein